MKRRKKLRRYLRGGVCRGQALMVVLVEDIVIPFFAHLGTKAAALLVLFIEHVI